MKRILLISVVFLVSIMPVFAQTVTPKPGAKLHYMNKRAVEEYMLDADVTERPIVRSLSGYKTVEVASSKELKVLGYAASFDDVLYDLYIVLHKGHVAFLNCNDVLDRSGIDRKIESVQKQYYELKNAPEIKNLDVVKRQLKQRCQDSLDVYNKRLESIDDVIEKGLTDITAMEIENMKSIFSEKEAVMDKFKAQYKRALTTLLVTEASLSEGNSVGGHDITLTYLNMSDKVIKYLNWTAKVKNGVGDYVSCSTRHISTFKGKETGPVDSGELGGGTWDNVIYNWSARELEMQSISIIYMDGSTANLSRKEIDASEEFRYRFKEMSDIDKTISDLKDPHSKLYSEIRDEGKKAFGAQIKTCEDKIAEWRRRSEALDKPTPDAFTMEEKSDSVLAEYVDAYAKSAGARANVRKFERTMGLKETFIF